MKRCDIQSIEISADYEFAFDYISNPKNLPEWTNAFRSVSNGDAVMNSASGSIEVNLTVKASREYGNIDWHIKFPDGSDAAAYSRILRTGKNHNVYTFVLMPPPALLEQLEGALEQQSKILNEELARLRHILEVGK